MSTIRAVEISLTVLLLGFAVLFPMYGPQRWRAVAAGAALALVLLWWVPKFQIALLVDTKHSPRNWAEAENGYRTTWAQIFGGGVLLFGAFAAWRNAQAAHRNAAANEQGQITERFMRAIDQIGTAHENEPNIEVRLGGVYALEQIARDAPQKYHRQVFEVLTAYVRRNAREETEQQGKPREDVRAVLRVVGRRDTAPDPPAEPYSFARVHLRRAYLYQANLSGFSLIETNLDDAHLTIANLSSARLDLAKLQRAEMGGANLISAVLTEAQLQHANLTAAKLHSARLNDAKFSNANLFHAELQGAQCNDGTDFTNAFLGSANLDGANLAHVRGLTRSQLSRAEFGPTTILPDGISGRTKSQVCVEKIRIPGLLDD